MEGSLECFIQEQVNPNPVKVAVNHARLDKPDRDRARGAFVTVTDPIFLFHRSEGPNITPHRVPTHSDAVEIPRIPFTMEGRIGDSVCHDQVLTRSGPDNGKPEGSRRRQIRGGEAPRKMGAHRHGFRKVPGPDNTEGFVEIVRGAEEAAWRGD